MKKALLYIILAAVALAATSCFKYDPVIYGQRDICTVDGSDLVSDFGIKYHVTEMSDSKWKEAERVFITFDVLETLDNDNYNIRLNDYTVFTVKSAVIAANEQEALLSGKDPIYPTDGFLSGSANPYLNLSCAYVRKKGSEAIHNVNVVYDVEKSRPDHPVFHIVHDASGDIIKDGEKTDSFEQVRSNLSIPVKEILVKGTGETDIELTFGWYTIKGETAVADTFRQQTHLKINF